LDDWATLIQAGRDRPTVDRAAGDQPVVPDPTGKQRGRVAYHPRSTRPGVDDRVPLAVCKRSAQSGGVDAVRVQRRRTRRRWPTDASRQCRDGVPTIQCRLHDRATDMVSSAQYEKPHAGTLLRGYGGPVLISP